MGGIVRARTEEVTQVHVYNGMDDRVATTSSSGTGTATQRFIYDSMGRVVAEYGASATDVKAEFVWLHPDGANDNEPHGGDDGMGGYAPLAVVVPGTTVGATVLNWVHANHLGVPIVTTDASGMTVTPYGYNLPGFPGQSQTHADLYYNRYRDYDPTLGRYIQADPIGLDGDVNPYQYAGGNPVSGIDPWGLEKINGFPNSEAGNRSGADAAYAKLSPRIRDNYLHIFGHGGPQIMCISTGDESGCKDAKDFIQWLKSRAEYRKNPNRPIVLWGCYTGSTDNGIAANLAYELKVRVIAPNDLTWWSPTGFTGISQGKQGPKRRVRDASKPGAMRAFDPQP